MAREKKKIEVKAYAVIGGVETDLDSISAEERREFATALKVTMLNSLYQGRAVFSAGEKEK